MTRHEAWMQVSSGQGPAECELAVVKTVEHVLAEAVASGIEARIVERVPGKEPGTASSVLISLVSATPLEPFIASWRGSIAWTARSPYRPAHRRKNWFVGVEILEPVAETRFDVREVRIETKRASGAGGQHVNTTESAVRVTHVPTGLQATASEERSQHANRRLALARLQQRLAEADDAERAASKDESWKAHQDLQRGNPVRRFKG